jgi:tRNA dimethylallyltransferase
MFDDGLMEEVQTLLDGGLDETCQCMQGIGYKEVVEGLKENWSIEEIKELIKKNTRNYAKRQLTYFKRMENHIKLAPEEATAEQVIQLLQENK